MTREERELLAKDLCARLPYRVKVHVGNLKSPYEMVGMHSGWVIITTEVGDDYYDLSKVKPYLRPLSSITSAEKSELELMGFRYENGSIINEDVTEYDDYRNHPYTWVDETKCFEIIEFLNSHHFDYMGLIEKGLALEAEKDTYKS